MRVLLSKVLTGSMIASAHLRVAEHRRVMERRGIDCALPPVPDATTPARNTSQIGEG